MEEQRHYAVTDVYNRKLTLTYKGKTLAETSEALILKEVGKSVYNPVFYLPKNAIKLELELDNSRQSHCPIKGDATYWYVKDDPTTNYFGWSYEESDVLPKAKKIKGYIAFNMQYVTIVSEPIE